MKDKKRIDDKARFWFGEALYESFREKNGILIDKYKNEQCKNVYYLLKEEFLLNKYLNLYYSHPDFGNNEDINKKYLDFCYENGVRHYSEPGKSNLIPCKGNYERTCNVFREIASSVDNYLYTLDENIRLEKLRTEQLCKVKSNDFIYTGKNCQDGLAHGLGTAVGAPGQGKRALDGEFSEGVFVKGKLRDSEGNWYDGPVDSMLNPHGFGTLLDSSGEKLFKGNFVQGKAEGPGVCEYQGATESCMYTAGRRTDQVHLMRVEVARMEKALAEARTERERAEQARQENLAMEQRAARERADSNGGARTNSWAADAINAINGGGALMQQQMNNDYSATQQLRQRESAPSVNWEEQRAAEAALAAKQAEMNRLISNQSGANSGRMGSGYGGSVQDCGIELALCGNDSVCRERVSQSSICSNDNSSDDVKDCRHYGTCNDSRVKPNPNIK